MTGVLESTGFDASTSLTLAKSVLDWIFDVITGQPILAGAFVCAVLVPVGFSLVRKVKGVSK